MTEIFLLGSFHFLESEMDFFTPDIQAQLRYLCDKLAAFEPSKIGVEAAVTAQPAVDSSYERLDIADFDDPQRMKTHSLGTIRMFGNEYSIAYNNEAIQIGYRLGKMLGHDRIYAIDDDSILENDFYQYLEGPALQAFHDQLEEIQYRGKADDIKALFDFYNASSWSRRNHQMYLLINSINIDGAYDGTAYVAKWYERNLRIFSNLQALCIDCDRLLIVYGAGHLEILRQMICASESMRLIEYDTFL